MKKANTYKPGTKFSDHLSSKLQDPRFATTYIMNSIQDAVKEEDIDIFRLAIGDVAKARGIQSIAEITDLPRPSLYQMISETGNPSFKNIQTILNACGLTLAVIPSAELDEIKLLFETMNNETSRAKGSSKLDQLSEQLIAVLGSKATAREEVVSKLWAYIKKNGLVEDVVEFGEKDMRAVDKKLRSLTKETHSLAPSKRASTQKRAGRGR